MATPNIIELPRLIPKPWFNEAKKIDATAFYKLQFPIRPVKTFFKIEDKEMKHKYPNKYKLVILYDNGTEYHVNGVVEHTFYTSHSTLDGPTLHYKHFVKKSKAVISVIVPSKDIAALTIKKRDEIVVKKLKPCAVIKGEAYKRKQ